MLAHFFVIVLLSKRVRNIERNVDRLLAPYDEQKEVPEYEKTCPCVGSVAKGRAYESMRTKFGTIDTKEALEFGKQMFDSDPDRNTPDPKCRLCAGAGSNKWTLNPDGKWDWYTYGGRWDGAVHNDWSRVTPQLSQPYQRPSE